MNKVSWNQSYRGKEKFQITCKTYMESLTPN
jgi:hypothetical protein